MNGTGHGGRREGAGARLREPREGPGFPIKLRVTAPLIETSSAAKMKKFVGNRLMSIAGPATRSDCMRCAMRLGLGIYAALIMKRPHNLVGPLTTALEASGDINRAGVREALVTLKEALRAAK